jgi:hypothetical protein
MVVAFLDGGQGRNEFQELALVEEGELCGGHSQMSDRRAVNLWSSK